MYNVSSTPIMEGIAHGAGQFAVTDVEIKLLTWFCQSLHVNFWCVIGGNVILCEDSCCNKDIHRLPNPVSSNAVLVCFPGCLCCTEHADHNGCELFCRLRASHRPRN